MKRGKYIESQVIFPGSEHDPDLPVIEVALSRVHDEGSATYKAFAVIDTGSGPTVLSDVMSEALKLLPSGELQVVTLPLSPNEAAPVFPCCSVRVTIDGVIEETIKAVVMPLDPDVVLGRDVLNHLRVTLDASCNSVELELGERSKQGAP